MASPRVTLEEVQRYAAKWIPRLHLCDWEIEFRVAHIPGAVAGHCSSEFRRRVARITLDPTVHRLKDLPITSGIRAGRVLEGVVVHELLHIHRQPHEDQLRNLIWKDGEQEPESWVLFQDFDETVIDTTVRVLLEADATGGWSK